MKKLFAILTPLLLIPLTNVKAQSNGSYTLFYDSFTNNSLSNWNIRWGNWRIENGTLISELSGTNKPGRIEIGYDNWQNYKLEVDVKNISGVDEGIGFRNNRIYNTSYELTLRHGTGIHGTPEAVLYKVQWQGSNENTTVLARYKPTSLINNRMYHITIEVIDTNIKAWIDQELIFNYQDSDFRTRTGFINFSTWTGIIGYEKVLFDNVKITSSTNYVQPFLDLPWDYRAQETTFNYMALNPYSWFDHQYPLQNECCNWQVMNYTGETIKRPYRSHNGYDYSSQNGIRLNTPVLAAAAGTATFKPWNKTGGAGNMIKIDHGNGYQTWYEHLSSDNLIVSTEGQTVDVEQGQQIGLVGMTGNTNGPHIHFSVFKDSNSNGSFNDEIPYGVTDPLGWEGETVDPWSVWSNGTRSGTTSYNLFSPASFFKSINIPPTGGTLTTEDTTVSIPAGTINGSFNLVYKIGPFESLSDYVTGIAPSFSLNAYSNGLPITQFSKPIRIIVNYSKANLTNIKEGTIRFRYFNEQSKSWEELPTTIDTVGKTISTEVNHLTRFIPMGEVKDLTPPSTTAIVTGEQGESNWYRTPVKIELLGQDNEEGIGLEYTLYTIDGNDWFEYTQPLVFNTDGDYQIAYQSYDKAENQEQKRTLNFHIDQTPPEVSIDTNPKIIWPPNNKLVNILLTGTFDDESQPKGQIHIEDEYNSLQPSIYDFEGLMINETIKLQAMRKEDDLDGRTYLIKVTDLAGNVGEQIQILVPHDQRN